MKNSKISNEREFDKSDRNINYDKNREKRHKKYNKNRRKNNFKNKNQKIKYENKKKFKVKIYIVQKNDEQ